MRVGTGSEAERERDSGLGEVPPVPEGNRNREHAVQHIHRALLQHDKRLVFILPIQLFPG